MRRQASQRSVTAFVLALKHSSRNVPLTRSMRRFSVAMPGLKKYGSMPLY